MNLAEVGNRKWKSTGSKLSLLGAAKDDIVRFVLQDEEIQQHRSMLLTKRGRGPNGLELAALERQKQEKEARGLAELIKNRAALKMQLEEENNLDYFMPKKKAGHKPPKKSGGPEGVAINHEGKKRQA